MEASLGGAARFNDEALFRKKKKSALAWGSNLGHLRIEPSALPTEPRALRDCSSGQQAFDLSRKLVFQRDRMRS